MPTEKLKMPGMDDVFTKTEGQGRFVTRHFARVVSLSFKLDTNTGDVAEWSATIQQGVNAYTHIGTSTTWSRESDWHPVPVVEPGRAELAGRVVDGAVANAQGLKDLAEREAQGEVAPAPAPVPRRRAGPPQADAR